MILTFQLPNLVSFFFQDESGWTYGQSFVESAFICFSVRIQTADSCDIWTTGPRLGSLARTTAAM
jgi:hypothetical protein